MKAAWILYAFLSLTVTFILIDKILSKDYASISQSVSLDESWDITVGGATYQNVSLPDFTFGTLSKGDKITMQCTLPPHLDFVEGALRLHIKQTAVKIFINEEQIYEYGHDRMAQNKTVGSGYLLINLPSKYEGQPISLELTVSENKAFSQMSSLRIYEWENIYRALLTENRIPLFVGCFLTVFGLVTCIITAFALIFSMRYLKILCLSVFSICMGLWTLCYYNVILIFSIPLYSICLLEYLTLYLAPFPLILYLREDVMALKQKSMHAIYRILFIVQLAAASCMLGLHMVDLVHCASTLKYMQILIVCNLIFAIIVEIINLKASHNLTHRLFLIGMLILAGCVAYDLLYYNIDRYFGKSILPVKGISSLGLVAFIFILFVTFYISITQHIMQEAERSFLIKSAGEVIAISETADSSETENMIRQFQQNIAQKNQEIPDLNMSIACGYASCTVKDYNIDKVYQLADDRMYENKKLMKQAHR